MTAYNAAVAKTITQVAATVDTVQINTKPVAIEVVHQGNVSNPIYILTGPTLASVNTVTSAGDNCEVVLPGERIRLGHTGANNPDFVGIIGAGAAIVTVIGIK